MVLKLQWIKLLSGESVKCAFPVPALELLIEGVRMHREICSAALFLSFSPHSHKWKIPPSVRQELGWRQKERELEQSGEEVYLILLHSVAWDHFYSFVGRSEEGGRA